MYEQIMNNFNENKENQSNWNETNRRRASDTYVPISLVVSTVAILSGLWAITTPLVNSQIEIQNRLIKLETKLELHLDYYDKHDKKQ